MFRSLKNNLPSKCIPDSISDNVIFPLLLLRELCNLASEQRDVLALANVKSGSLI